MDLDLSNRAEEFENIFIGIKNRFSSSTFNLSMLLLYQSSRLKYRSVDFPECYKLKVIRQFYIRTLGYQPLNQLRTFLITRRIKN